MRLESFPRTVRLRKRAEFVHVQRRGRKAQGEHFLLLHLGFVATHETRIGVTVSSKVGNAVVRNRLKRWVREWVRRHRSGLPEGHLVFVARSSAAAAAHPVVDRDLGAVVAKLGGRR